MLNGKKDYADTTPEKVHELLFAVMGEKTPDLKFIKTWSRYMVRESVAWVLGERNAKPAHFRYYERK